MHALEPVRGRLALGVLGLALAVGVYALWPHVSSPEESVRAAVQDMERGLERRDAADVLSHVSEQFRSSTLGDRADLRRVVLGEVLRGSGLKVVTLQAEVQPESDGRVRWVGRVAAARAGGAGLAALTEAQTGQFHVEALFADENGEWRLVEATVTPVD